jgi:hypothetical protein
LRRDIDQTGDRVFDVKDRLESLEQDSGDETIISTGSSGKDEPQSQKGDLAALKLGFNDLQKSFDIMKRRFDHSEDITLLLRTEVSHIRDRLGNSEEETADSELEGSMDSSDCAVSFHEQIHLPVSVNDVD